ncbi:hypothetical protein VTP01DRAFT_7280 [Rhizomucor pusillus]|uniref:uncharacterized protein n=1 Tax=Rhizomucor pusillus TaxID=4840 RepID=UPI0037449ABE
MKIASQCDFQQSRDNDSTVVLALIADLLAQVNDLKRKHRELEPRFDEFTRKKSADTSSFSRRDVAVSDLLREGYGKTREEKTISWDFGEAWTHRDNKKVTDAISDWLKNEEEYNSYKWDAKVISERLHKQFLNSKSDDTLSDEDKQLRNEKVRKRAARNRLANDRKVAFEKLQNDRGIRELLGSDVKRVEPLFVAGCMSDTEEDSIICRPTWRSDETNQLFEKLDDESGRRQHWSGEMTVVAGPDSLTAKSKRPYQLGLTNKEVHS